MEFIITDENDERFIELSRRLDEGYFEIHGEDALKYNDYNSFTEPHLVLLVVDPNKAIACGSFRKYDDDSIEIKRVFVSEEYRSKGIAFMVMQQLESIAADKGYKDSYLVTGRQNHKAIGLYKKLGYDFIENTGFFSDDEICITMKKQLE